MAERASGMLAPDRRRALELALEAYRCREVSLGRASEMARVPITVFLDELRRANLVRDYGEDELRHDLRWAHRE